MITGVTCFGLTLHDSRFIIPHFEPFFSGLNRAVLVAFETVLLMSKTLV
jgi:hypothetical protein